MTYKRGDRVLIQFGFEKYAGMVLLASANGKSLMLGFDAVIDGHFGSMPVLQDDTGEYKSIVTDRAVKIRKLEL